MSALKRILRALLIALSITAVFLGLVVAASVFSGNGADLSYRSVDYDVKVQPNGDLKITQHVDLTLREREDDDATRPWKQLYQQYRLDSSKLTDITNVSVTNVTDSRPFSKTSPMPPDRVSDAQWDEEYANHWYIADVTDGTSNPVEYVPGTDAVGSGSADKTIEIGWNIPATTQTESLKFDISTTFKGVSTAYADVASLQWEPVGEANQIPIGRLSGTVTFPSGVDANNSWAWLHYSGTSQTSRTPSGGLKFTAYDVRAGQWLDVVAAFDVKVTRGVVRTSPDTAKDRIMRSEAQQESAWRDEQHAAAVRHVIVGVATTIIGVIAIVWGLVAAVRTIRASRPRGDVTYRREPPDMSPAAAAALLAVTEPVSSTVLASRQLSATMLSLASKHAIVIRSGSAESPGSGDSGDSETQRRSGRPGKRVDTFTIAIQPVVRENPESLHLSGSERGALDILLMASHQLHSDVFDLAQMRKRMVRSQKTHDTVHAYEQSVSQEFLELWATRHVGAVPTVMGLISLASAIVALAYFAVAGNMLAGTLLAAPLMVGALTVWLSMKSTGLNERGSELAGQVLGLRQYLLDFSDFSDRGPADLVLWDRYLVYATAFGISRQTVEQLAKAYPQMLDPAWFEQHAGSSLLYSLYNPYAFGFGVASGGAGTVMSASSFSAGFGDLGVQLSTDLAQIQSTIGAAGSTSSSSPGSFSSGGFGGFSGGSGGGSFGGR